MPSQTIVLVLVPVDLPGLSHRVIELSKEVGATLGSEPILPHAYSKRRSSWFRTGRPRRSGGGDELARSARGE